MEPYYSNQFATLKSRLVGGGNSVNPLEYGKLKGFDFSVSTLLDELTYTSGDGTEYVFRRFGPSNGGVFLIDRIEQPGVDFDPRSPSPGRRGVSFVYDENTMSSTYQRLNAIVASDGVRIDLHYAPSTQVVDYIDLVRPGGNIRRVEFDIESFSGDLREIREVNSMAGTVPAQIVVEDRIRKFDYSEGLMTADRWYVDTTVSRETRFEYNHDSGFGSPGVADSRMISRVISGDASAQIVYSIQPGAIQGMQTQYDMLSGTFTGIPSHLSDLTATLSQSTNTELFNETTNTGASSTGTSRTEYQLSLDGQILQKVNKFLRLPATDGPALSEESWKYDHLGSVVLHTDELGRETHFRYDYQIAATYTTNDPSGPGADDATPKYDPDDYRGNVVQILAPNGLTLFEYETDDETLNALGRLVRQIDPRNTESLFVRETDGRLKSQRIVRGLNDALVPTDAIDDFFEQWDYYDVADTNYNANYKGLLNHHTDTLGLETSFEVYDSNNRPTKVVTRDEGAREGANPLPNTGEIRTTEFTYDATGMPDLTTLRDGDSGPVISAQDTDYDVTGQLRRSRILSPDDTPLSESLWNYDPDGRITESIDGNGVKSVRVYDKRGLMTSSTAAAGAVYRSFYTGTDDAIQQLSQYEYYSDGSLKQITHPDGTIERHYFNPLFDSATGKTATWVTMDRVSNGEQTIDSSSNITFNLSGLRAINTVFDVAGRLISTKDLLTGEESAMLYGDARIDQPTRVRRKGAIKVGVTINTMDMNYAYDADGRVVFAEEGRFGRKLTAGLISSYDELGVLKETKSTAIAGGRTVFETDSAGNVLSQTEFRRTWKDGSWQAAVALETEFIRDEQGRIRKVIDPVTEAAATPVTVQYSFDTSSGVNMLKTVSTARNGLTTAQWMDAAGQIVREQTALGTRIDHDYDLGGNLVATSIAELNRVTTMKYDGLNRLRETREIDLIPSDSVVHAIDYFLPGDPGADGWNIVQFAPLDASVFDGPRDPKIREWATRTQVDSLGRPIYMQSPDPGAGADGVALTVSDTPTTLFTYNYAPGTLTQSVTMRLSVARNVNLQDPGGAITPAISKTYGDIRVSRTVTTSDGRHLLSATRDSQLADPDSVGDMNTFVDPGFVVTARSNYGLSGRLSQTIDGEGNSTGYSYDTETGLGLLRGIYKPNKEQIWFRYDSAGNQTHVLSKFDPALSQSSTEIEYDGLNRRVKETITADGLNASGMPDGALPVRKLSRNWTYQGPTTIYTDRDGRRLTSLIEVNAATAVRRITETSSYMEQDASGITRDWNYSNVINLNAAGDALDVNEDLNRGTTDYFDSGVDNVYDRLGRQVQSSQVSSFQSDISRVQWNTSWHANGQREDVTLAVGGIGLTPLWTTSYETDNRGLIRGISRFYESTPEAKSFWNANGDTPDNSSVKYEYLADGQRANVQRYGNAGYLSPDAHGYTVYGYDDMGRNTSIEHRQNNATVLALASYSMVFDSAGKLTQRGIIQRTGDTLNPQTLINSLRTFQYDAAGQLESVTEDTNVTPYNTDSNGNRLADKDSVIGKANRLYSDSLYSYRYDNEGRLIQKTSHFTRNFDNPDNTDDASLGLRVVAGTWTTQSGRYRRPNTGSAPADQLVSFDTDAQIDTVFADMSPGTYDVWMTWQTPVDGSTAAGGTGSLSGLPVDFSQAPTTLLDGVLWQNLGTVTVDEWGSVTLTLIRTGNDPTKAIALDGIKLTPHEAEVNYGWDIKGRLLQVVAKDAAGDVVTDVSMGYDYAGRKTFRHDALSGAADRVYVHDGLNTVLEYGFGTPAAGQSPVSWFYGAGVNEIESIEERTNSTGTGEMATVWAFGDTAGTVRTYGWYDSPNNEWRVVHRNFGEFGEESPNDLPPGDLSFPFLNAAASYWAGHHKDRTTGLTDMKSRWYDESTGRFLSEDPLGFASGDTNFYRYVGNGPTNAVDPDGRVIESLWDVFSIGLGLVSTGTDVVQIATTGEGWGNLALDFGGLAADIGALFLPGIPGGAGVAIKASRTTKSLAVANKALEARWFSSFVAGSHTAQNVILGMRLANHAANVYQAGQAGARSYEAHLNDDAFGAAFGGVQALLGIGGNFTAGLSELSRWRKFRVAARLDEMTLARFVVGVDPDLDGPVLAAAYDPMTGAYSRIWRNLKEGESGPDLLGTLRERAKYLVENFSDSTSKKGAGFHYSKFATHGEVLAVNELLAIRIARGLPTDELTGIVTRVISTEARGGFPAGSLFRYCQNCASILNETWSISARKRASIQLPWEWQV